MAFRTILKLIALLFIIIAAVVYWTTLRKLPSPTHTYKIGVIQTIEHPALDKTRQGTLDELNAQGFKDNLQWSWESAQMNQALAAQIAQKFIGQQVDLMVAIGTPAAQAALNAARTTNTPVIFASVTDPKSANLSGNITGVSNLVPVENHFDLISQILPATKRLGIIYNPGDANSVTLVEKMQALAIQKGLDLVLATVSKTSEVPAAAQSLMGKVDAVFVNNDNTALAAFDGIARVCRESKIPLFASDTDVLEKGALAVRGPDQYDLGRQTGRMAAKILRKEAKAADLAIEYPEKVGVYLNDQVATELSVTFPADLKKQQVKEEMAVGVNGAELPLVVITQIVQHDALDREREGILDALKDAGFEDGKTVRISYENAQGNIATATQIAAKFASQNPRVAIGISTPSAQSLIQPMKKHGVPVVFAAVTDPLSAKLVSSLTNHSENVTGVSDGLPLRPQLQLIQHLIPAAKRIGVLYNSGESNSVSAVKKLRRIAADMGFSVEEATTAKTADTIAAAQSLVGKVDAIFIPNDNTVMASITALVALGRSHHLPIFNPDYDAVERGVLAVRASSHHAMGYKAGQLAVKILKGAKAADLPVETTHDLDLAINMTSADALGIPIPEGMKAGAKLVS
jgi:putative ABC transport system substrate-binding protein